MSIKALEEPEQKEAPLQNPPLWSPENSIDLYRINTWGKPYYTINTSGNVSIRPHGDDTDPDQEIDLFNLLNETSISKSNPKPHLPLIFRFPDILKHRMESLQSAFDQAIYNKGYKSRYRGVYPVKSNQDRFIVEDIVEFGAPFEFGLESGSKPELLLAMNCLCKKQSSSNAFLICNGYKDPEYIRLAFIAQRLKINVIIVLELESEIDIVISLAQKLGVNPVIGVRAKLETKHDGHFGDTSGENGKFGLNQTQIERIVKKLKSAKMMECLQLLHFHIGSQIQPIEKLTECIGEGARIYSSLMKLGAPMGIIDVGGGLAVDYGSIGKNSIDYTVEEYAEAVVEEIIRVCEDERVDHPIICSESGRAITSHHSVLVFEAFERLETTYHVNLSIFTSIPDYWGIEQYFPIMPIHRLDEQPRVRGVLSDITCDSDGMVKKFTGEEEGEEGLMLHEVDGNGGYYLGMFLGGAYQEALGGHHNLFGRPTVVRVVRREGVQRGFEVMDVTNGPTCGEILRVMHHDPVAMVETLRRRASEVGETDDKLVHDVTSAFDDMPYLVMIDDHSDQNGYV